MDIFHIYCNTSGNSGLYLDTIYETLNNKFEQRLFVNYYYPFKEKNIIPIYFKFTEKNENNNFYKILTPLLRKCIRLLELIYSNIVTLSYILKYKPKAINYSLTNMPFVEAYIRLIKKISPNTKIIITCHDVVPFEASKHIPYQAIYDIADYLIVHNEHSIKLLKEIYSQDKEKIFIHDFPIMDLSKLVNKKNINLEDNKVKFLYIGYIRDEKGVDILIDSWSLLGDREDCELTIAGYLATRKVLEFEKIKNYNNVNLILRNLSDREYIDLVNKSDYVIFPYKQVGNSGVLSTTVSMNKIPITSDLPVFLQNKYVSNKLTFKSQNPQDLKKTLEYVLKNDKTDRTSLIQKIQSELKLNRQDFDRQVNDVYNKIFNRDYLNL